MATLTNLAPRLTESQTLPFDQLLVAQRMCDTDASPHPKRSTKASKDIHSNLEYQELTFKYSLSVVLKHLQTVRSRRQSNLHLQRPVERSREWKT